jgi:putative glycosyltransferase (TIGR04372 family)
MLQLIKSQVKQIQQGGTVVLFRIIIKLLFYVFAIPPVLIIRMIKPWLLVRIGRLKCQRFGHFIGNTELYLCKRDAGILMPNLRHVDLFFMPKPVCNQQLAVMWQRVLRIWPAWMLGPIYRINRLIPGGQSHDIEPMLQTIRDVHNLLDESPPHLKFTTEEEARGEAGLRAIGIPIGAPFVCLNVRDSAYLDGHQTKDWSYHTYRDSDIQNYVLAAETLAERGYFVIRMGAKVHAAINSVHPKVIDYATNGMRSEFMDIYLGAKSTFSISTATGWDEVPQMLRRPVVYVNMMPLGKMHTFRTESLSITRRHVFHESQKALTLSEIFSQGVGFCQRTSGYESAEVDLYENTPEEILDVAIEMDERLNNTLQAHPDDESLQQRFWEIFPADTLDAEGNPLHGEIRSRFGAAFLRNNQEWLL